MFPLPLFILLAGLIINLTQDGLTGEKFNLYVWELMEHETQISDKSRKIFICFRQKNNKFVKS